MYQQMMAVQGRKIDWRLASWQGEAKAGTYGSFYDFPRATGDTIHLQFQLATCTHYHLARVCVSSAALYLV